MPDQKLCRSIGALGVMLTSIVAAVLFTACNGRVEPADMVLANGKIVTVDDDKPEAQAVAIRGDIIVAVGSDEEIQPLIGENTEILDLDGKLAVPGFIDGHGHLLSLGRSKMRMDASAAGNWDELVAMVKEAVPTKQPGEWILGRGWHQEKWDRTPTPNIDGLPFHHELSRISPDNPVMLYHASGHACIANARAMELAGITRDTPDPEGGEIVRGPDGDPIGVFREEAHKPLDQALADFEAERTPEQIEAEERQAIELAIQECLSHGVTSFHDAACSLATIDLYRQLAQERELSIRLWIMISDSNECLKERLDEYRIVGLADNHLTVRAIKRFMDGALGSHGAWLLEPYADLPTSTGLNIDAVDVVRETARLAMEHDFQLCTHAIGDRANREVLNIYEEAFRMHPDRKDLRWRIEHAQHLHPDDIARFGRLGVTAAMQAIHCTSDGPWVPERLGDLRAKEGAYVWQKLMKSGALVINGTDAPVEDVDPLANFYAAVTRRLPDGALFYPEQRMSREEALRSYTINCAYAAFEEGIKGSITVGKLADITILSKDIMTVPDEEIPNTEIVCTIVGGEILYSAHSPDSGQ